MHATTVVHQRLLGSFASLFGILVLAACAPKPQALDNSYLVAELPTIQGLDRNIQYYETDPFTQRIACGFSDDGVADTNPVYLSAIGLYWGNNGRVKLSALFSDRYGPSPSPAVDPQIWKKGNLVVLLRNRYEGQAQYQMVCIYDVTKPIANVIIERRMGAFVSQGGYAVVLVLIAAIASSFSILRTMRLRSPFAISGLSALVALAPWAIWKILPEPSLTSVLSGAQLAIAQIPWHPTYQREPDFGIWAFAVFAVPLLFSWLAVGASGMITFSRRQFAGRWGTVVFVVLLTGLIGLGLFVVPMVLGGPITYRLAQKSSGRTQCTSCKSWVNDQASVCPHCRSALMPVKHEIRKFSW